MFSICIPAYNEEESIRNIYENITRLGLWKTSAEKELVFCINGSTDNSERIALEIAKRDPHVRVLVLQEKGKNNAWMELVRRSNPKSKVLLFADADVVLKEDSFGKLLKTLHKEPNLAAASAKAIYVNEKLTKFQPAKKMVMKTKINPDSFTQGIIHGRCYAIRREEARKIIMPKDQRIHEDTFLTLKLWGRFRVVNEAHVYSYAPTLLDTLRLHKRNEVSRTLIKKYYPSLTPLLDKLGPPKGQKQKGTPIKRAIRSGLKVYRKVAANIALARGSDTWAKQKSTKPKTFKK